MDRLNIKYIDEINSFHDWLLTNSISSSARLLWFALMHYCNKTGWKREFNVAISALELDTGLSKQSIIRARNSLQQSGRIIVRTRRGNQSSLYQIIPFAYHTGTQNDTQTDTLPDTQTDKQADTLPDTQADTIPRLDKTRLEKTSSTSSTISLTKIGDEATRVIREYQNKISPVSSPKDQELLLDAIQHFSPGWVSRAIDVAAEYNAHSVQYVLSVLRRWEKEGEVDDGASWNNGRQNRKDAAGSRKKSRGNTVRTDWSDVPTSWDDVKI